MRRLIVVAAIVVALLPTTGTPAATPSSATVTPDAPPVTYTGHVAATPPAPSGTNGSFSWAARPVSDASGFGEPSIDVDHAGRVFVVAPGGAGVQMWRSFDGGVTFSHKEIATGGGGDSEVEFTSDDVG